MNSKKQKIILIISIIVIIVCTIISITIIFKSKSQKNELNANPIKNSEILNDVEIANLSIKNANVTINNDVSNYTAIITNKSDEDYYIKALYIVFTIDGVEHKLPVVMDTTLAPKETQEIIAALDSNISETTKIDYVIE